MRDECDGRALRTNRWKLEKPMMTGATITVSTPAAVAAASCTRMASRSPDRLGT
jgi:hypothetical protein